MRSAVALARRALDADLHVTATRDRDELRAFLDERLGPYGTVVIVGGDGSLGVAYNAVADRDTPLVWSNTTLGGKQVESAVDGDTTYYLYAKGDVLFFLSGDPASTEEAISGLP